VEKRFDLEGAFAEHEVRVFTYFRRMAVDRDTARDLTQETLYRAFRDARRFRGDVPVGAWLLGIARNVFREWLRKTIRDREHPPEYAGLDPGPGTETIDVERAMARLDPEHREVLVLRFALDLPGEDVAGILGITHEAVRQRVARAKAEFKRIWEE
jgi:RNA polymerase sigma-70 factor (ECF subfamily)